MSRLRELQEQGQQRQDVTYDEHTGIYTFQLEARAKRIHGDDMKLNSRHSAWPTLVRNLLRKVDRRLEFEPWVLIDLVGQRFTVHPTEVRCTATVRAITEAESTARKNRRKR